MPYRQPVTEKEIILLIAVVQIAKNSIQSMLFSKTYNPPVNYDNTNNSIYRKSQN